MLARPPGKGRKWRQSSTPLLVAMIALCMPTAWCFDTIVQTLGPSLLMLLTQSSAAALMDAKFLVSVVVFGIIGALGATFSLATAALVSIVGKRMTYG